VTLRGWEQRVIVDSDQDREDWQRLLDRVAVRCHWRVFAWVLMSNHFHLFLRTPAPNLSAGMHDLNPGFASPFNRRHRRVGSLFQGRFKAILVEDQTHAWELSRYLHLNPVRAKIVSLPEQYRWSSYGVYRFLREAKETPSWLDWTTVLGEHSTDLRNARRAYLRFVERGIKDPPNSPLNSAVGGIFFGQASWVERMCERLAEEPADANVPRRQRLAWRPTKTATVRLVKDQFGADPSDLQRVRRHGNDARTAAVYLIRRLTDEKVITLAEEFGGVSAAAISKLLSRAESRRAEDPAWDRLLDKLEREC
jgi:REP element-mobilizing transposase RayT